MIQIDDNDLPITVAEKIVRGTKPNTMSDAMKNATEKIFGVRADTEDMFSIDEIKEIADYLLVYYESHHNGD